MAYQAILCLQMLDQVFLGNLNPKKNLLQVTSLIRLISPHRAYSGVVSRPLQFQLVATFSEPLRLLLSQRILVKLTSRSLLESSISFSALVLELTLHQNSQWPSHKVEQLVVEEVSLSLAMQLLLPPRRLSCRALVEFKTLATSLKCLS